MSNISSKSQGENRGKAINWQLSPELQMFIAKQNKQNMENIKENQSCN